MMMSENVKRYDWDYSHGEYLMLEDECGEYVKYDDYAAQASAIAALKEQVATARNGALEEAAKLCESDDQEYEIGRRCAVAIRDLASQPAAPVAAEVPVQQPGDAPDLIVACKALIRHCDENWPMGDSLWCVQQIRDALATTRPSAVLTDGAMEFVDAVIEVAFDGGDLDGGSIQDLAEKHGLLEAVEMTAPCSEGQSCRCADGDNFPLECYRKTYSQSAILAASGGALAVPDVIREGVEAAFEEKSGWRMKVAAAVRALPAAPAIPGADGGGK